MCIHDLTIFVSLIYENIMARCQAVNIPRADLAIFFRKGGPMTERGSNKLGGRGACQSWKLFEILIANGAF